MKNVNISARVMKKIVQYERKRITLWLRSFVTMTVVLVVSCLALFGFTVSDLMEKRAFDVLELFTQDREIIAEFWKEVLQTFWEEMPQGLFFAGVTVVVILIILIVITRRKRMIIDKKLRGLEKFS
jgi:hypothetical protein